MCDSCAIYGHDGTLWVKGGKWKGFSNYDYEVDAPEGKLNVKIDEFKIALAVAGGNRNPSDAGTRLFNQKFSFTTHDEGVTSLSRQGGGGAILAKTSKAVIISTWDKEIGQDAGDCSISLERVFLFLKKAGF